jgi:hypothetical protein
MFGWYSQERNEIAESLVKMIVEYRSVLQNEGIDSLRKGIDKSLGRGLSNSSTQFGVEEYVFFGDEILREFRLRIEDRRKFEGKGGGINLQIEGDQRYFGFSLYCDLLTGRTTVDATDTMAMKMLGNKSTRKARTLCKVFARKYASATSGVYV